MDDLRTRAQLVAFDPTRAAAGATGTLVPRAEFADTAARGEFPATLLLDLDRVEAGDGGEVTAHATIAVDWDKDTLDQLLASTDEPEIALWFDERELARAFADDDVEGHGLRERVAVLAVAVAAAGVSATPALSQVMPSGGSGGGGGQGTTAVQPMGVERAMQQDAQITVSPAQGTTAAQPMGVERTMQQDAQITPGQAGPTASPVQGTGSGGSAVTATGSGVSASELAAIAGAGAVLISAAGFGAARKRTRPVQPA